MNAPRFIAWIFLLCVCATVGGRYLQSADDERHSAALQGKVVDSMTGEGLSKARLYLRGVQGPADPKAAISDREGKFFFRNIEPGRYALTISRNGYAWQQYGQRRPGGPGTAITLRPGQTLDELVIRLIPGAVIAGRVVDEDNEPLANVQVAANTFRWADGKKQLTPLGRSRTDDRGEYRLFGLMSGRYYISAVYRGMNTMGATLSGSGTLDEDYVLTYYPSAADPGQSIPIDVEAGTETPGIDIRLVMARTVSVKGRVLDAETGRPERPAMVMLLPQSAASQGFGMRNQTPVRNAEGHFAVHGVTPGSYILYAFAFGGGDRKGARVPVEAGGRGVEDLTVAVSSGVTLPGRVEAAEEAEWDPSGLRVILRPRDFTPMGTGSAQVDPGGRFEVHNLLPAPYEITVWGLEEDFYLKSARIGRQEALDAGLDLTDAAPPEPLEIVVSPNGARIDGVVFDKDGEPVSGARVVLVPDNRGLRYRFVTGATDQEGVYSLRGVAPGKYDLFAWEDAPEGAWMDPGFLTRYRDHAESCEAEEGQAQSLDLELIPAGE